MQGLLRVVETEPKRYNDTEVAQLVNSTARARKPGLIHYPYYVPAIVMAPNPCSAYCCVQYDSLMSRKRQGGIQGRTNPSPRPSTLNMYCFKKNLKGLPT